MNKLLLVAGIALVGTAILFHTGTKAAITDVIPEEYVARFSAYKKDFNKKYSSSSEETFRLAVFYTNMVEADLHNANPDSTWVMGETQFSDLTQEEFAATYLNLN